MVKKWIAALTGDNQTLFIYADITTQIAMAIKKLLVLLGFLMLVSIQNKELSAEVMNGSNKSNFRQVDYLRVTDVAWSPNGLMLGVATTKGLEIYSADPNSQLISSIELGYVGGLKWDPFSTQIVTWRPDLTAIPSKDIVEIWDLANDSLVLKETFLFAGGKPRSLSWHPDGSYIATNGVEMVIIHVETGQILPVASIDAIKVFDLVWSPNGDLLAISSRDRVLFGSWDSSSLTLSLLPSNGMPSGYLAWGSDPIHLAIARENTISVINIETGIPHFTVQLEQRYINDIEWMGSYITVADDNGTGEDGNIYIIDANSGEIIFSSNILADTVSLNSNNVLVYDGLIVNSESRSENLVVLNPFASFISGQVWQDSNADGLRSQDETMGIANLTVNVLDTTGAVVQSTSTDAEGRYTFEVDSETAYVVEVIAPNRQFTAANVGSDEALDSDVDPLTGRSEPITLAIAEEKTLDIGILP